MSRIIRDSSIWKTPISNLSNKEQNRIDIGIVIEERYSKELDSILYLVETYQAHRRTIISCTQMIKVGDVYNYEEIKLRSQSKKNIKNSSMAFQTRLGEMVLVACVGGVDNSGIIIGSVRHPGRALKLTTKDMAYASEYNGLETTIDKDGAYKIKFQGTPTNLKDARDGSKLAPPKYDDKTSGSYLSFDKTGSFILTDASKEKPQTIKIDKQNGFMTIVSGDISMTMDKKSKKISIKCEEKIVEANKKMSIKTPEFSIDSSKSVKIKGQKIAIGYGGNELLEILSNLIDEIGQLVIISPVGTCTPIQGTATWPKILLLKNKISSIKGSL
jgi:phage gp45-like